MKTCGWAFSMSLLPIGIDKTRKDDNPCDEAICMINQKLLACVKERFLSVIHGSAKLGELFCRDRSNFLYDNGDDEEDGFSRETQCDQSSAFNGERKTFSLLPSSFLFLLFPYPV